MSRWMMGILSGSLMLAVGCGRGGGGSNNNGGGGTGGGPVSNSVPIVVSSGPTANATNTPYVSVTVCVPGTSNCQIIDNVIVDTGSSGLRILKTALTVSLPQQNGTTGNPLLECAQFVSFSTWGPVQKADVKMAGEIASSIPVQVIGEAETGFPNIPKACHDVSAGFSDTLQSLQANGILGVGVFRQDCGSACSVSSGNPAFYFECGTQSGCLTSQGPANVDITQQASNPVWKFSSDNNGVLIQLPQVAADGAPSVNGTMFFGIGTQSNNGLGSATILALDSVGTFTTTFAGKQYPGSFIDSGSNGIFFLTPADQGVGSAGISECTTDSGFYCPATTVNLSATNGPSSTVQFSVANAEQLPQANFAFNDLSGDNAGSFDWGLGFFYGRNVFTAIEGQTVGAATGPFFAY